MISFIIVILYEAVMRVMREEDVQAEKIKWLEVFTHSPGVAYMHKKLRIMNLGWIEA